MNTNVNSNPYYSYNYFGMNVIKCAIIMDIVRIPYTSLPVLAPSCLGINIAGIAILDPKNNYTKLTPIIYIYLL